MGYKEQRSKLPRHLRTKYRVPHNWFQEVTKENLQELMLKQQKGQHWEQEQALKKEHPVSACYLLAQKEHLELKKENILNANSRRNSERQLCVSPRRVGGKRPRILAE